MKKYKPKVKPIRIIDENIRRVADYQTNWHAAIEPLHPGRFHIESTDFLSIHGDAPKNFVRVKDYVEGIPSHIDRPSRWPAYIAKVGSKWYPIESVTEHLLTRVGQIAAVNIAESQLRIVGNQVRFLSKYFLRQQREQLTHGLELFRRQLDEQMVDEIANARLERDIYTFQVVCLAVRDAFPDYERLCCTNQAETLADSMS